MGIFENPHELRNATMEAGRMKGALKTLLFGTLFVVNTVQTYAGSPSAKSGFDMSLVARGRYLLKTSGCNDCHTHGYLQPEGNIPERF